MRTETPGMGFPSGYIRKKMIDAIVPKINVSNESRMNGSVAQTKLGKRSPREGVPYSGWS